MPTVQGNKFARTLVLAAVLLGWCLTSSAQSEPGVLAFLPATYSVSESAGSVQLTVKRQLGAAGAISVSFATGNGTAMAGNDYTAAAGSLAWTDGETADKTINVAVLQNATLEGSRYFTVVLSNATGGASIGVKNGTTVSAPVKITDDEADTFPVGSALPAGFMTDGAPNGGFGVTQNEGYLSPASLGSSVTQGYTGYFCYYDDETYQEVCYYQDTPGYSRLWLTGDFLGGDVTFSYRVDSHPTDATFRFFIDGNVHLTAMGQTAWNTVTIPVPAGTHVLSWQLSNASFEPCATTVPRAADGTPCADRAFVDTLTLPPQGKKLTVAKNTVSGFGAGTVTGTGIACGTDCSEIYPAGTVVTLSATPDSGSAFIGWSGSGCSGTGDCIVTMSAETSVTATFAFLPEAFPVDCAMPAGWTRPPGAQRSWNVGLDRKRSGNCSLRTNTYNLDSGFVAQIQAQGNYAAGDVSFFYNVLGPATTCLRFYVDGIARSEVGTCGSGTGVSGDVSTWTQVTVPVSAGPHVFVWSYEKSANVGGTDEAWIDDVMLPALLSTTLNVTKAMFGSATGAGTVTGNGIDCGSDCSETFAPGAIVTLSGNPATGSNFYGWTGECAYVQTTCVTTMHGSKTITASFGLKSFELTVNFNGTGRGEIQGTPAINCSTTYCSSTFYHGTLVTLTASPQAGSVFAGWSGGGCAGTDPCVINMDGVKSVEATFSLQPLFQPLTVSVFGSGSVSSQPAGIACPGDCYEAYMEGTIVTLTALPGSNYAFTGWSGGVCTGTGPCTVTMDTAKLAVAQFSVITHSLTISMAGDGTGSVSGYAYSYDNQFQCNEPCIKTFTHYTNVYLNAAANSDSIFAGWSGTTCAGTGMCNLTMEGPRTVTATFIHNPQLPTAPGIVEALPGNATATFTILPPLSTGTSPVTQYRVYCDNLSSPGGDVFATGAGSPIIVSPLINGVSYSCRVSAQNSSGYGTQSAAVVVTPTASPILNAVRSRKFHPGLGNRDIDISPVPMIDGLVSVEPRDNGTGHLIVFRFDRPITSVGTSTATTGFASHSFADNEVLVTMTGVPDNRRVTVSLTGVNGSGSAQASMGFLVGDVTGNRSVNAADVMGVKARLNQAADDIKFRFDLNTDGIITQADVSAAKVRSGRVLP